MLNRSKLATVAALALSVAWVALSPGANAQPRDRGADAFDYQSGEQTWRDRPSRTLLDYLASKGMSMRAFDAEYT